MPLEYRHARQWKEPGHNENKCGDKELVDMLTQGDWQWQEEAIVWKLSLRKGSPLWGSIVGRDILYRNSPLGQSGPGAVAR